MNQTAQNVTPKEVEQWLNQARVIITKHGNKAAAAPEDQTPLRESLQILHKAYKANPQHPEVHRLMSSALMTLGMLEEAIIALGNLTRLTPDDPKVYLGRASCYERLGHFDKAADDFLSYLPHETENRLALLGKIGNIYFNGGNLEKARGMYEQAAEEFPDEPEVHMNIINILGQMNLLDEERAYIDEVKPRFKDHAEFLFAEAELERRDGHLDTAREKFEHYIKQKRVHRKANAMNRLAMVLEKQGNYQDAYEYFADANTLAAKESKLPPANLEEYARTNARILEYLQTDDIKEWDCDTKGRAPKEAPIVFVGFPRSGTTILEQMLSAHPRIEGTNEAPTFQYMWLALNDHKTRFPDDFKNLSEEKLETLRGHYFASVKKLCNVDHTQHRILDKRPLNINYLVFPYRVFPEAKTIIALRDPRDVILSNFKQFFALNVGTWQMLSLESTVNHYILLMETMLLSVEKMNLDYMFTRYEEFIEDPEAHAREVVEFIGEEWHDDVLRYREMNRFVNTPSLEGVLKPIYKSAKGSWKNYEEHMLPYRDRLEPLMEKLGYEW